MGEKEQRPGTVFLERNQGKIDGHKSITLQTGNPPQAGKREVKGGGGRNENRIPPKLNVRVLFPGSEGRGEVKFHQEKGSTAELVRGKEKPVPYLTTVKWGAAAKDHLLYLQGAPVRNTSEEGRKNNTNTYVGTFAAGSNKAGNMRSTNKKGGENIYRDCPERKGCGSSSDQ